MIRPHLHQQVLPVRGLPAFKVLPNLKKKRKSFEKLQAQCKHRMKKALIGLDVLPATELKSNEENPVISVSKICESSSQTKLK